MRALAAALLLAGCARGDASADDGAVLERAAVAAGLIVSSDAAALVGLWSRDTDQLCLAPGRGEVRRIGVAIDYGGGQACSARGTAALEGGALRIDLGKDCRFAAEVTGTTIAFPADLPAACDRACTDRASLSALAVDRQGEGAAEARALRDGKGQRLCS